jgi:ABC-type transport system substrate-binding protein
MPWRSAQGQRGAGHGARAARAWTRPPPPAAAIGEIVHYNILEGLTKINVDGTVTPLLAESWGVAPDGKSLHLQAAQGREVLRRRPSTPTR